MRSHLLVIFLFVLAGCGDDYTCGAFVYSEAEGRCVCPPGFIENDDFTSCVSLDGGHSDGGPVADAGPIADAHTPRDSQVDGGDSCADGATVACTTSEPGECAIGVARCVSGAWGACEGAAEPMPEICNTRDDDCDGETDEALRMTFYRDVDGDGYGTETDTRLACAPPSGYVARAGDCFDTNASVHPGQTEYFAVAIAGAPAGAQYDYDCDGMESPRYGRALQCINSGGSCPAREGFLLYIGVSIPDAVCGETREDFVTGCSASCETNYETRTQPCR